MQAIRTVRLMRWDRKAQRTVEYSVTVSIDIDLDAVAGRLAGQAAGNKSGKSKYIDGAIVVKATSVKAI